MSDVQLERKDSPIDVIDKVNAVLAEVWPGWRLVDVTPDGTDYVLYRLKMVADGDALPEEKS